jgi:hypothetical protein
MKVVRRCTYTYIQLYSNARFVASVGTEICFGGETLRNIDVYPQLSGVTDNTLKKTSILRLVNESVSYDFLTTGNF